MAPPPNPHVAQGLALVAAGLTLEEAAQRLQEEGRFVSARTIRRALERQEPPRRRGAHPPPPSPAPAEPINEPSQELTPQQLAEFRDLIGRLPFAQQDHLLVAMPLERLRREAIARGIAPHRVAAAAVARELRAVGSWR